MRIHFQHKPGLLSHPFVWALCPATLPLLGGLAFPPALRPMAPPLLLQDACLGTSACLEPRLPLPTGGAMWLQPDFRHSTPSLV